MKTFILDAVAGEYDDLPFLCARVHLTPEDIDKIYALAKAVVDLKVYKIAKFDHAVFPMDEDGETPVECSVDSVVQNVTNHGVFWSGYMKHTDLKWETSSIPLEALDSRETLQDLR